MNRDAVVCPPVVQQYDHHEFPGVVPRTFLGPLALSLLTTPIALLASMLGLSKVALLVTARLALAGLLWWGFARFTRQVAVRLGPQTALWLVALTTVQFHYVFYSSRTLPNTFASAVSTCCATVVRLRVCVGACVSASDVQTRVRVGVVSLCALGGSGPSPPPHQSSPHRSPLMHLPPPQWFMHTPSGWPSDGSTRSLC